MATPRRSTQQAEPVLSVSEAVASHLDEISVLCLQLESGEKLSAFLTSVSRCTTLWREYVDEQQYKTAMLRVENLVEEDSDE